jgi:hypothetical protein
MSRSRLFVAIALAASAVSAPAYAAKKPPTICNLVKDAPNDASAYERSLGSNTYDPSLDIISADVNANATAFTAVIRVKQLTSESQIAPTGRYWFMSMTAGTSSFGLRAYKSPLGAERFTYGKGKFDVAKNEIRIHATHAELGVKLPKGTVIRGFLVSSNATVGLDPAWGLGYSFNVTSGAADSTNQTPATFKVGSLSCVKVGV